MTRSSLTRRLAVLAASLLGLAVLLSPTAASAAVPTTIRFVTPGPLEVGFGEDWLMVLTLESVSEDYPVMKLTPSDGTVDVFFSGIGGAYAATLPIQPDGSVYVSQPSTKPLLPRGTYNVTAIFNPVSGGYYSSSKTEVPLVITVSDVGVVAQVEVINDAAVSEMPVITATLGGKYVEAHGGSPAGTWHFTVTGEKESVLFETDIPQVHGDNEAIRVEITPRLQKGEKYTVKSTFTPVGELAGGVTVAEIRDTQFETPSGTLGELLASPAPIPLWLVITLLVLLLGLVAAAIILGVTLSNRPRSAATQAPRLQGIPGDPGDVQLMSLDDVGITEIGVDNSIRNWSLSKEAQTEVLPVEFVEDALAEDVDVDLDSSPSPDDSPPPR